MTAWETNNVALLVHKNRPTYPGLVYLLQSQKRSKPLFLAVVANFWLFLTVFYHF